MCKSSKHILIIESKEDIQKVLKLSLKMDAGWEAIAVSPGSEAIILAQATKPDAIILDATMPNTDILNILQQLQTNSSTKSIPIIAIAQTARCAEQYHFKKLGVAVVVPQLFDPVHLAQYIAKALHWQ
jgi:CheY-like chemotaxis protein